MISVTREREREENQTQDIIVENIIISIVTIQPKPLPSKFIMSTDLDNT